MLESYAERGHEFGNEISDAFGKIGGKIPTFERTLDTYFDKNGQAIIDEWGLLTPDDLESLELRLNSVSREIDRLYGANSRMERRMQILEDEIRALEAGK